MKNNDLSKEFNTLEMPQIKKDIILKVVTMAKMEQEIDIDETIGYAYEGLLNAEEFYDETINGSFENYAFNYVYKYTLKKLAAEKGFSDIAQFNLFNFVKNDPTLTAEDALVEHFFYDSMEAKKVSRIGAINNPESLNTLINEPDNSLEDYIEQKDLKASIKKVMSKYLNEAEQYVLSKKYNLDGLGYRSTMELSLELEIFYTGIIALEEQALKKLRQKGALEELRVFIKEPLRIIK